MNLVNLFSVNLLFIIKLISYRGRNDLPPPTAVCSDPLTRLAVPTHNANPRSLAALRQSTGHAHPFASYGQQSGYDKSVKLVAVRRLRIINMMIGKLSNLLTSFTDVYITFIICLYVCMYVRMYVCMYVCTHMHFCFFATSFFF